MVKDIYHDQVKKALFKDGWKITHDPLIIQFAGIESKIDLGAEKIIGAQKDGQKIAIEIKSFFGDSAIYEFHLALGQYLNYRLVLDAQEPDRLLYLAVPQDIYDTFFIIPFTQIAVQHHKLQLVVYDPNKELIVRWTP